LNEAPTKFTAVVRWLSRLAPLLIVITALCYYGSYIGFWFNPHDEGGTAAFTAMRLLAGEAPIRDVELGYNVGWYAPIVALFKLTGVNFLVMRGYFFALSTITALLGWMLTRRLSRNDWLALGVGLALVFFPGSQFKNYNPLLVVANMLCVASTALALGQTERRFRWSMVAGGLVLGLTLLVRIDIGFLFGLLWGGFLVLLLFQSGTPFARRAGGALIAAAILLVTVIAAHVPAWLAARSGGYAKEFTAQYGMWIDAISSRARAVAGGEAVSTPGPAATSAPKIDRTTLPRMTWSAAGDAPDKRVLVFLTYLPPLIYALLLAWLAMRILPAVVKGTFALDDPTTLALLVLIASMAAFPQFFFFRPDRPHLSEFMPGYIVATVSAVALLAGRARWTLAALLAAQFGLYGWYALDHYSAGTIAARWDIKKNKRQLFTGANGVRVWVHKEKDFPELEGVRSTVVEHSKPGDWLICYPYQPGYNVMTDRPSYEKNLYQDNATAPRGWARQAIARIEEKKPAVVVIDDRAINKVEASRFSVWAAPVMEHLRANYQSCAKFDAIEVFARKP
jgi:hypothetical protein